ncbi:MAG: hypothetical protein V3W31_05020 [Thermodesulfobacteriota bacterium]
MLKSFFPILLIAALSVVSCGKGGVEPTETPEEVVARFYAYVEEGGTTTLGEAYRLISKKHYEMHEDIFKNMVKEYPKGMDVKIIGSTVEDGVAVVTIEYRVASMFNDYFITQTDINLEMDEESNSWKIDFTGETYDETPSMYAS